MDLDSIIVSRVKKLTIAFNKQHREQLKENKETEIIEKIFEKEGKVGKFNFLRKKFVVYFKILETIINGLNSSKIEYLTLKNKLYSLALRNDSMPIITEKNLIFSIHEKEFDERLNSYPYYYMEFGCLIDNFFFPLFIIFYDDFSYTGCRTKIMSSYAYQRGGYSGTKLSSNISKATTQIIDFLMTR